MEKPTQEPAAPSTVTCGVCSKQIPKSEAKSAEGTDYVMYFCGLDCFEKWKSGRRENKHGAKRNSI